MNSGTFKKGEKRLRQGQRGPGKITLKGREALAAVIEGNVEKLQGWLDEIERRDGPKEAFRAYVTLLEFGMPKMSRAEVVGDSGPNELIISWQSATPGQNVVIDGETKLLRD